MLECYVLWAIGELPDKEAKALAGMTPMLRMIYNRYAPWPEIIEWVVDIDPDAPKYLREMWQENQEIARQNNAQLTPQSFAKMIVNEHFIGPKSKDHSHDDGTTP